MARTRAYAPYSRFRVGAALLTEDGQIFLGCNIENVSYGATTCAERIALYNAVANGHRRFQALAMIVAAEEPITPCGLCRQVIHELSPDLQMIMATTSGKSNSFRIGELIPNPFSMGNSVC